MLFSGGMGVCKDYEVWNICICNTWSDGNLIIDYMELSGMIPALVEMECWCILENI